MCILGGLQGIIFSRTLTVLLILIVLSSFSPASFFIDDKSYEALAQHISSPPEKELLPSTVLLNQVEEFMPNISMVIGIVSPNGTQVYSYGNISDENGTNVNGDSIFDIGSITNLATHTSGLPDLPIGWNRNQSYTNEQVYNFLSNMTLQSEPGVFANYSDFGMGLLGHILTIDSGISYEKLVKDRILNVLGMDSTGIAMNS